MLMIYCNDLFTAFHYFIFFTTLLFHFIFSLLNIWVMIRFDVNLERYTLKEGSEIG